MILRKDYYIACYDEVDIEEELYRWQNKGNPTESERTEANVKREALREIDRLKISGDYETTRADHKKLYDTGPVLKSWKLDPSFTKKWNNLRAGMKSPDLDQRALLSVLRYR